MSKQRRNITAAMGAGRNRDPWRIKEYLASQGQSMAGIARKLDITHSVVSRTVNGAVNNRGVLRYLRDLGCPERYLSLPDDLKQQEVA